MIKKTITLGGIAFLLFFVALRPDAAANVFKSLGGGIVNIVEGFGDLFERLTP